MATLGGRESDKKGGKETERGETKKKKPSELTTVCDLARLREKKRNRGVDPGKVNGGERPVWEKKV